MQFGNLSASDNPYKRLKLTAYTGMTLSVVALVLVAALSVELSSALKHRTTSTTTSLAPIFVTGLLITPPLSLPDAPPILTQQPFGQRLTDINVPLNSSQLAVINDEPNSFFDTAARILLNGSLPAQTHRHKKTETEGPQAPHFQQRFQTASRSIPGAY